LLAQTVSTDPALLYLGKLASPEQLERVREELGVDQPWYIQYSRYLARTVRGDLGISHRTHRPVSQELLSRLPASLEIIVIGLGMGFCIGIFLGIVSARKPNSILDQIARLFSVAGISLPQYWYAIILQLFFGAILGILPIAGRLDIRHHFTSISGFYLIDSLVQGEWSIFWDVLSHLILPAITLSAYVLGMSARLVRAQMIEILGHDYIRTARAFGVHEYRILTKHALRIAIGPVFTLSATSFTYTLVGTFLVESIFSWPGIGSFAADSILSMDIPVIMGVALLVATSYVVFNLLADIAVALADPRIRMN